MAENRTNSFTFFESFYEASKLMNDEDRLAYFDAIIAYAFTGEEQDIDGISKIAFITSIPNIDNSISKRKASEKGNKKRWDNPMGESQKETCDNPDKEKEKEKDGDKEEGKGIGKETLSQRAADAPCVEEVREYFCFTGLKSNPEEFFDFYESKGWLVGKTPMKDWKSSARNWERNHSPDGKTHEKKEKKIPDKCPYCSERKIIKNTNTGEWQCLTCYQTWREDGYVYRDDERIKRCAC